MYPQSWHFVGSQERAPMAELPVGSQCLVAGGPSVCFGERQPSALAYFSHSHSLQPAHR